MTQPLSTSPGSVGGLRIVLRLEGLSILMAGCWVYHFYQFSWGQFFLYFFLPDIGLLGYLVNSKIGAFSYNLTHSYILPLLLGTLAWALDAPTFTPFIIIWIAHIGFDRALGYGLKYTTGFKDTHLGRIGWNRL